MRSNPNGALGFVADPRRLNVAITRAKRGLVVVGNPATLKNDPVWRRWLAWVEKHGCVLPSNEARALAFAAASLGPGGAPSERERSVGPTTATVRVTRPSK